MSALVVSRHIPSLARARKLAAGADKMVDLGRFGFVTDLSGADAHGTNDSRDVLVTNSINGIDYNEMWAEFQATLTLQNAERQAIVDFFTFPVTEPLESVSQLTGAKFEEATEYGEPRGVRQAPTSFWLGYDFKWFDIAIRYTWKYLANATSSQVESLHASVIAADNQNVFAAVLQAIYNPANRAATIDGRQVTVYALYNNDGTVPPSYKSNVFDNTHNHYMVSGDTAIASADLDALSEQLRHHGYDNSNGVQQIVAVNSTEGKRIRQFRILTGATYDFIPSTDQATSLIIDPGQTIAGGRPSSSYAGLHVIGSYGQMLIIEDDLFIPGYAVIIGSGGKANLNNPVGFRQHESASLQGLRLVKGPDNDYPLIDSFYLRGFGTGIRQRGGSAVMQIKASGSYAAPTQYLF